MRTLDFTDGFESATEPSAVDYAAEDIVVATGNLDSDNVQDALEELQSDIDAINDSKGAVNGIATLDSTGKIPNTQIPQIAITEIHVVNDITERDALSVESGDVAKVIDSGDGSPRSYMWDGSQWIEFAVDSYLASDVTVTPSGNLSSTNVQAALQELQGDIDSLNSGKQDADSDLTALAGVSSTGLIARTGSGTAAARTLTAGSSKVSVSNGDGVAGNPTVDVQEGNLTLNNIGGTLSETKGGTNQTSYTKGDILYASNTNTLSKLAGNTSATKKYLSQQGDGSASAAPVWETVSAAASLPRGYISGLIPTRNSATQITISAGVCRNSTNSYDAELAIATQVTLSGASANTTYHLMMRKETATGDFSLYFDTSASGANVASGYEFVRRLYSLKTDGSSNIPEFTAREVAGGGLHAYLSSPVENYNQAPGSTNAVLITLAVPTGISVEADLTIAAANNSASSPTYRFSSTFQTDVAPSTTNSQLMCFRDTNNGSRDGAWIRLFSDTSGQIRARASVNLLFSVSTEGWTDHRRS